MWWMPWRQEAMKDVGACDKPRGAGKHAMIRGCPNGETRRGSYRVIPQGKPTRGTETSKYPEERKSTETPQVAASERGPAQTVPGSWGGVVDPHQGTPEASGSTLGRCSTEGDTPVHESGWWPVVIQSTLGHVEPGGKQGGPSSKAKYYLLTDSEQVP